MWCGRVLALVILILFLTLSLAGSAEAHHRRQYYWAAGGGPLQSGGGHGIKVFESEYAAGGFEFDCPSTDCTVAIKNLRTGTVYGEVCGRNTEYGFWHGCRWIVTPTERLTGYKYMGVWPSDPTGYGTIDVYSVVNPNYGYGLERSFAHLQFIDPTPAVGPSLWELIGAPSPGCYRHFLDVNQDGNLVSAAWIESWGIPYPPDLYFFDEEGARIGQDLAHRASVPLPAGTHAIMACNVRTVNVWGGSLLNPWANAPLLSVWITEAH